MRAVSLSSVSCWFFLFERDAALERGQRRGEDHEHQRGGEKDLDQGEAVGVAEAPHADFGPRTVDSRMWVSTDVIQ